MLVELIAGPVPLGCAVPDLDGVEEFVRRPMQGEATVAVPCPICSGAGVLLVHRRGLRSAERCRRCAGTGRVEGVPLLRLVAAAGHPSLLAFSAWARDARIRVDPSLRLREEGAADDDHNGAALVWATFRGEPLRERHSFLVGRQALGIAAELNGKVDAHVAAHVVTADGRVHVVGLWDVAGDRDGEMVAEWSEPGSRAISRRWSIRFPEKALQAALDRAACCGCHHIAHFGPNRCGQRRADRGTGGDSRSHAPAPAC